MPKIIECNEISQAHVVYTTSDLVEGRSGIYPMAVCKTLPTAKRLGKERFVQGSNCPIQQKDVFRIGDVWYGPVKIHQPSKEDEIVQKLLDEAAVKDAAKQKALEKAKEAGLSDEDIEALQQ